MGDANGSTYLQNDLSFSTKAVHIGSETDQWKNGDVIPPICMAAIYEQTIPSDPKSYKYARVNNPTRSSLENCLASLEETKFCIVVSSGMAAVTLVTNLLKKGDHVIAQTDIYAGTLNMLKDINESSREIEITFVDATEEVNVAKALRPNTKLVWLESPTNPLMKLVDINSVTTLVKKNNQKTIVLCDNTFMTPYFQRPSSLGVDIVLHSCTKYIGGHSDVLMGALCTNNEQLHTDLRKIQIMTGAISSPFDCFLVIRSLKTLELRMQRIMTNALQIASFLEGHPLVEKVFHPGLESHPQHELALRQTYGSTGTFSFYLRGHDFKKTKLFVENLHLIILATSLGGTETVLKIPSRMPRGNLSEKEMEDQGITDGLVRISTGLENPQDLINDLDQALRCLED